MRKIPCVYMRGGTSKGVMFMKKDLPEDKSLWDDIFIKVMGGPDPKQIDGLGGTVSSNNKIVVVSPSSKAGIDVEYLIAQIVVGKPVVDYSANCGNMTSAVGPYAISQGLVKADEPIAKVRMLNLNTDKIIEEYVPMKDGCVEEDGDCSIAGIDGTGAELIVKFIAPTGAKTGKLFPTGRRTDEIAVEGLGKITATIADISGIALFILGRDIGIKGDELPSSLNSDKRFLDSVERIRGTAAVKLGLVDKWQDAATATAGTPKLVILAPPTDYTDIAGRTVKKEDMDVCVRVISVGAVHKASPLTCAAAIGGVSFVEGTVIQSCLTAGKAADSIRIGHPSGVMKVYVDYETDGEIRIRGIACQRTARRLMEGYVYVRE